MQKWIFTLAITGLIACNNVDKGDDNNLAKGKITISGNITGMDTGHLEILFPIVDGLGSKTDTISVKKGKFLYQQVLKEPTQMLVRILGTKGEELAFFGDPGEVVINGHKDSLYRSEVKGGANQVVYKAAEKGMKAVMMQGEPLYMAYVAAQQQQNLAEMQKLEFALKKVEADAVNFAIGFAKKNRSSIVAAYLGMIYLTEPEKATELQLVYDTLTPAVKKSFFGTKLGSILAIASKTAPGAMAPDFSQNDVSGKPMSLSALRGKYILLDFWASWCAPCRQENPNVVLAYNSFKDKGFDILSVSLDKGATEWEAAIKTDKLTWHHVSDLAYINNSAAVLYGIKSIPSNFLIDKEGKIIAKNLFGAALTEKLRELMP